MQPYSKHSLLRWNHAVVEQDNTFGLSQKTMQTLDLIFAAEPTVEKVIVYGSRAKGNYREGSDIDLTLIAPDLQFRQLLKLQGEIEESSIPQLVDLSILSEIKNPALVDHINRVGKIFYIKKSVT